MKKNTYFSYKWTYLFLISILSIFGCKNNSEITLTDLPIAVDWSKAHEHYHQNIVLATSLLDSLKAEGTKGKKTKYFFAEVRKAFKKAEPYASYLNPEVGHKANGPALPIYKSDSGKVIPPVGLQKLEETIYENEGTEADFNTDIFVLKGMFGNLRKNIEKRPITAERFFIATHQQLMRIVSLAMAGFDTPVSQLSIDESAISLESLAYVYENSVQELVDSKDARLSLELHKNINKAAAYIKENPDFIDFDRFVFIRDYLNPITRNWVKIRQTSKLWEGSNSYPFDFDAPTFFEKDAFNPNFFAKTNNRNPTAEQIELGKKLFFEKKVSKDGTMSCATCHSPEKAYTDGLQFNKDNNGNLLLRNTPTLLNASFQKAFFWDGRSNTLEDQISAVFSNKKEFNTGVHQFSNEVLKDSVYVKLFKKAYGKVPNRNTETINAIADFVATLTSFDSKFDKNIRGEIDSFTTSEKNGFNLFMGKALCATCHFMPLTNGTVPPFFTETEKEVIGVPETNRNKKLDDDLGFYNTFGEDLHRGMFKTVTVRNSAITSPYMHNGVYQTLEEVINFYAQGGGGGMGFDLPHQTLPFDKLELSKQDQIDLVDFMETLTDTKNVLF